MNKVEQESSRGYLGAGRGMAVFEVRRRIETRTSLEIAPTMSVWPIVPVKSCIYGGIIMANQENRVESQSSPRRMLSGVREEVNSWKRDDTKTSLLPNRLLPKYRRSNETNRDKKKKLDCLFSEEVG